MANPAIGARLKAAREAAGFKTAIEFALQNGIPQPTYALHEGGRRGLKWDVAENYGELLGVEAAWIMSGKTAADTPDLGSEKEGETLPNRIREHRLAAGLTLEQLAGKIGTTNQQVQRLETGARKLSEEWMVGLAEALGVPVQDLLSTSKGGGDRKAADETTIGGRLRSAREAAGISQADIARKLGISRAAISQWEANDTNPDIGRFGAIADAYGVAVDWLVTGLASRALPAAEPPPWIALRVPEGEVALAVPPNLSQASWDDVEAWLQVIIRAARRAP